MESTPPAGSLAEAIRLGRHREGIAAIMGFHPAGISRTRQLVLALDQLEPSDAASLRTWCAQPAADILIQGEQREVLEDLAAHEFGHIVVARALGFETGAVSLVFTSEDGAHTGTAEIFAKQSTNTLDEVVDYAQRRVMVHLAGVLAQWPQPLSRPHHVYSALQEENGGSDLQKAHELVRILLNIRGDMSDRGSSAMLNSMALNANEIVRSNFAAIRSLAARFASNIHHYRDTFVWAAADIDQQPEIANITVVRRRPC